MPRKKLPRNAPCPCGSGKKYGRCCHDKGFEYLVDEDGTIFKSISMSDELAEVIEEQKRKFIEQQQFPAAEEPPEKRGLRLGPFVKLW
jgi:hypothetical protein